jgi:cytochrome P450
MTAGITGMAPKILRPITGPFCAWPVSNALKQIERLFGPLFRERMELLLKLRDNPDLPQPQDHLQMMMRHALKEYPEELNLKQMTRRLTLSNLGSMHQTTIAVTNMLLNIIGSDPEYNTIAALREEIAEVIGNMPAEEAWSKAAIAKMVKADSVARETLRTNSFGSRAILRKVMKKGVITEDGTELPKGAVISILAHPIQHSEELFEKPYCFDPFRFSRLRESAETKTGNLNFVSTGPQFLPFGHGKHACPGRFLVDFELKMIMAYVLMNYDIKYPDEYQGKRPPNRWLTEANMPPVGARIMVKRRKVSL